MMMVVEGIEQPSCQLMEWTGLGSTAQNVFKNQKSINYSWRAR